MNEKSFLSENKNKIVVIIVLWVVNVIAFPFTYSIFGMGVNIFNAIPVFFSAWFLGIGGGLVVASFTALLNNWLFSRMGVDFFILSSPENFVQLLVVFGLAAIIGYLSDLRRKLEQANLEARQTADKLRELDRLKSQFLANMSHEIRTPLSAVVGMSALLMDEDLDEKSQERIELIHQSGEMLLAIINDVLDFSKIEAGMMEFIQEPFDFQEVINNTLNILMPQAEEKGLKLGASSNSQIPAVVVGDDRRLSQVLINLVSNAIKFTQQGGVSVIVDGIKQKDNHLWSIHFVIKDTGIGIAGEHLKILFDSFSQVDSSFTRTQSGTGLGLAIVYNLCQMMGGRVWVESEVGVGTSFHVELPFAAASSQEIEQVAGIKAARKDGEPRYDGFAEKHPLRILVAEDNLINQKVIAQVLYKFGYESDLAENGHQVLAALKAGIYDVVLMDVQMPEMDGIQTTREIREKIPPDNQPVIVALTAHAHEEDRIMCLEAGMNSFLEKPVVVEELYWVLSGVESVRS